jgi:excisionase family DNA binding protein
MSAVGNLNDYIKFQMAEGMAKGEAGGGMASNAAQLGAGLAMGQQLMAAMGGAAGTPAPAGAQAASASAAAMELLSPADAAKALGVTENDVLTALGDGSLKGKKIGATWRITRAALEDFLKS